MMPLSRDYWRLHLWQPLILFALVTLAAELSQVDLLLAEALYRWQGDAWHYRDHWLTEDLLHTGARKALILIWLSLLLLRLTPSVRWRPYHNALSYLLISSMTGVLVVAWIKSWSQVDCPWSLHRFGGDLPYVAIFAERPADMPLARCFPAGHASSGYGWFGCYFLALHYRPAWRWRVFAGVCLLGLVLGGAQQLRGAHFASHDLWTLGLSWLVAATSYPLLLKRQPVDNNL